MIHVSEIERRRLSCLHPFRPWRLAILAAIGKTWARVIKYEVSIVLPQIFSSFLCRSFFSSPDKIHYFAKYCPAFPFPFSLYFSPPIVSSSPPFFFFSSTDQIFPFSKYFSPCPSLLVIFPAYQLTAPLQIEGFNIIL